MDEIKELSPIKQGVKNFGSQVALAKALGVSAMAVCKWVKQDKVPPMRVLAFSKLTGIPRWCVAPELYPPKEN